MQADDKRAGSYFDAMTVSRLLQGARPMRASAAWTVCAILILPGLSGSTSVQSGSFSTACWTDEQLVAKPGELDIQKSLVRMFPPVPQGVPAKTTAVPRPNLSGVVRSVKLPPGKKLIALTFDLCEAQNEIAGYHGEIVDVLRAHDVRATFFMQGKWMESHRERAQQLMSDPQFEIGNHTWSHRNLRLLQGAELNDEISNAQLTYDGLRRNLEDKKCAGVGRGASAHQIAKKTLNLFRFPFGACDAKSLTAVNDMGLLPIQWSVTSEDADWRMRPEPLARKVLNDVQPGSIVLFHANGRGWYTDEALPEIIKTLRAQGYEFKTVSELLSAGEPVMATTCYDRSVGDTDQYDEFARRLEDAAHE